MTAQAECRIADDGAGGGADQRAERDRDPRAQVEIHHAERDRVGAQPPKSGMAEGEIATVSTENVPGQRQHCPEQHLGQHELVIGAFEKDE